MISFLKFALWDSSFASVSIICAYPFKAGSGENWPIVNGLFFKSGCNFVAKLSKTSESGLCGIVSYNAIDRICSLCESGDR